MLGTEINASVLGQGPNFMQIRSMRREIKWKKDKRYLRWHYMKNIIGGKDINWIFTFLGTWPHAALFLSASVRYPWWSSQRSRGYIPYTGSMNSMNEIHGSRIPFLFQFFHDLSSKKVQGHMAPDNKIRRWDKNKPHPHWRVPGREWEGEREQLLGPCLCDG